MSLLSSWGNEKWQKRNGNFTLTLYSYTPCQPCSEGADLDSQAALPLATWSGQCGEDRWGEAYSHCALVSMALWRRAAQGLGRPGRWSERGGAGEQLTFFVEVFNPWLSWPSMGITGPGWPFCREQAAMTVSWGERSWPAASWARKSSVDGNYAKYLYQLDPKSTGSCWMLASPASLPYTTPNSWAV